MVVSALSTVSSLAATCPASALRFSVAVMMSSVWSFSCAMKMSSWVSRLRMSFSRPASALANVWLISCSWPSPPPLSRIDTDASVCSVVG